MDPTCGPTDRVLPGSQAGSPVWVAVCSPGLTLTTHFGRRVLITPQASDSLSEAECHHKVCTHEGSLALQFFHTAISGCPILLSSEVPEIKAARSRTHRCCHSTVLCCRGNSPLLCSSPHLFPSRQKADTRRQGPESRHHMEPERL